MTKIFSQLLGKKSETAHALVLVQCPECKEPDYIKVSVDLQMQPITNPKVLRRKCQKCFKIVKLNLIENEPEKT